MNNNLNADEVLPIIVGDERGDDYYFWQFFSLISDLEYVFFM